MFIVKQYGSSSSLENSEDSLTSPELNLLYDMTRIILGDTIQLYTIDISNMIHEYIGIVIYNDSELVVLEPNSNSKFQEKLYLEFLDDGSLHKITNKKELELNNDNLDKIEIIEKAKYLGYIQLHGLKTGMEIQFHTETTDNEYYNLTGTIIEILNDSLILNISNTQQNLEIHFNYKGIPPNSGIINIKEIEIPDEDDDNIIVYLEDEDIGVIDDYEEITDDKKLYTLLDQSNDYIQNELSHIPFLKQEQEIPRIIREMEYWFQLIDEYPKPFHETSMIMDYKNDNYSNHYYIPIVVDTRIIFNNDSKNEDEVEDMVYPGYMLKKSLTIDKEEHKLSTIDNKTQNCEQLDNTNKQLWDLNTTYLKNEDCQKQYQNNINKNTLVIRDGMNCNLNYSFGIDVNDNPPIENVRNNSFDSRVLLGPYYRENQTLYNGEEYGLTGFLNLPYTYRTTVDIKSGIYTIRDLFGNGRYLPLKYIYNNYEKFHHIVDSKPDSNDKMEIGNYINVCITIDNNTVQLTGYIKDLDPDYIYLEPDQEELYHYNNIWKIHKNQVIENDIIIDSELQNNQHCYKTLLENTTIYPFQNNMDLHEKNNYLDKILLTKKDILLYQEKLLSQAYNTHEIDKILYYHGFSFKDIQYPYRTNVEHYLNQNNNYLIELEKYRNYVFEEFLLHQSMNTFYMKQKHTITNHIIKEMEKYYGLYSLYETKLDTNENRILWLFNNVDKGMLYLYLFFIEKDAISDSKKLELTVEQQQTLEELNKYQTIMKTDKCQEFNIVKYYPNLQLLEQDNQKQQIFYDKQFDNTPTYLLDHLTTELSPETIKHELKLKIQHLNDIGQLQISNIDDTINNIVTGGKIVQLEDKAIVRDSLNNTFHIYRRVKPATSEYDIWALDKNDTNITSHLQYCQQQGIEIEKIDMNDLKKCFYDTHEKGCFDTNDLEVLHKIELLKNRLSVIEDTLNYYDKIPYYNKYSQDIIKYYTNLIKFRNKNKLDIIHYKLNETQDVSYFNFDDDLIEPIYTAMEGFDKDGRPIITADLLSKDTKVELSEIKYLDYKDNDEKIYQTLLKWIEILQITLNKTQVIEIIQNIKSYLDNKLITFNQYASSFLKQSTKFNSKLYSSNVEYKKKWNTIIKLEYNKHCDIQTIYSICCFVFILLQITIPQIKFNGIYPLCKASMGGFPLDENDTNIMGIEYLSCILNVVKYNDGIWNCLQKHTIKKFNQDIKKMLSSILELFPGITEKYHYKRENNLKKQLLNMEYSIDNSFYPPLNMNHLLEKISQLPDDGTLAISKLDKLNFIDKITQIEHRNETIALKIINYLNLLIKDDILYILIDKSATINDIFHKSSHLTQLFLENLELNNYYSNIYKQTANTFLDVNPIFKDYMELEKVVIDDKSSLVEFDDDMKYTLIMNYTRDGNRRIVNKFGRCVISGEQSRGFLKSITLEESKQIILKDFEDINLLNLIDNIKLNNIVSLLPEPTITDSKDILETMEIMDPLLLELVIQLREFPKDIELEAKYSKLDEIITPILEKTNELIETLNPLLGNELLNDLGEEKQKMDYNIVHYSKLYSDCVNHKMIESNLLYFYHYLYNTIICIINNKLMFKETMNIPTIWNLSQKHQDDLKILFTNNNSIINKYSLLCSEDESMKSLFMELKTIMDNNYFMTELYGICHNNSNIDYIIYTNIIMKYFIIKILYSFYYEKKIDINQIDLLHQDQADINPEDLETSNDTINQLLLEIITKYQEYINRNNITPTTIDENWDKMGEIDKQRIIKRIDGKTDAQREVDRALKQSKLGEWAKGLSSSVWKYDQEAYDTEQALIEEINNNEELVNQPVDQGEQEEQENYEIEEDLFEDDDEDGNIDDEL